MNEITEMITAALEGETVEYKFTTVDFDGDQQTAKFEFTREDALELLHQELHFSQVAMMENYGTEVNDE